MASGTYCITQGCHDQILSLFLLFLTSNLFHRYLAERLVIRKNISRRNQFVLFIEMREKFDNGEDPLDPEQQQQGGHSHPFFHQGFNPFGNGGGGNFKFHFN